jgi:hypothetical protein
MSLVRRLALALALLPSTAVASGDAVAAEPAEATAPSTSSSSSQSPSDKAFLEARRNAKKATRRADSDPLGSFALNGCMTNPAKCTCQNEDAKKSSACGDVLGYFCRESTQQYLAASCMDLFGGATVCKCASAQQITSHLKAEETAAKKSSKGKKKSSSKKKSSKKK